MNINQTFEEQISSGNRFEFGRNWATFLRTIDSATIKNAELCFKAVLDVESLENLSFLDAGSGSGLSSLVAKSLGARRVYSFDFDPQSVECTRELKRRYFPNDESWEIGEGSVLDEDFVMALEQFDIVYSWGVLHHTGSMWKAMETIAKAVKPKGKLFIMIYADRGIRSKVWRLIKKLYCSSLFGRACVIGTFIPYYVARGFLEDVIRLKNPSRRYQEYSQHRGMSKYHDWIDWLGGYPFEVANEKDLSKFLQKHGFVLVKQHGVEYVYAREH